jgi:type IV pilus assembly protein PilY1
LGTLFQTAARQPITAAPSAAIGFNQDLWIYFGTGRYFDDADRVDTHTQSFYAIHDRCLEGGTCAEVAAADILDVTSAQVFTDRTVSGVTGVANFSELEGQFRGASLSEYGWKMDLTSSGERCLGKPSVLGGTVLFSTFVPNPDICSLGGGGKLYALYFLTGTAHYKPAVGLVGNAGEAKKSIGLGQGMPANLGIHVGTKEGATGFVQTSTGNIMQVEITPALRFKSRSVSWMHK